MNRRLLGAALLAGLVVIAAGALAALALIDTTRAAVSSTAAAARDLLSTGASAVVVAGSVGRPGVIVHVLPPPGALQGGARPYGPPGVRPLPGYGGPQGGFGGPPGGPPPQGAAPPPEGGGQQAPPGAPPGAPPPVAEAPPGNDGQPGRPPRSPLASVTLALARIPPLRVGIPPDQMDIVPDGQWLAARLGLDLLGTVLALVLVGVATWAVGTAVERASRTALLQTAVALERVAAADFTPQAIEASGSAISARLARAYNAAVAQVARSFEERQAAAREFQRFLADAGHELRTPLTIVSGYVDLLDSDKDRVPSGDRIVAGMRAETKRMRNLVEKMLLLSRMESTTSNPRELAVSEAVADAVDAARTRYPQRTIAFGRDDAVTIVADEDDIFEAVYNLLENALRYAPQSDVAVDVARTTASALISVSDRGPGIAPDEREHIFERFYRGAARGNAEGSGLGLAIVKRAVERWSGTIDLQSGPGNTRFTLTFPLVERVAS